MTTSDEPYTSHLTYGRVIVVESRKYLPTLSDLIDRLSIVQLKAIFIPENKAAYDAERELIEHDIDLILKEKPPLTAKDVRAIMVVMLANNTIWINESKARTGGAEQNHLLKFTHSVNGTRNTAKNMLAARVGERQDLKVDCFAADIPKEYGNWRVFTDEELQQAVERSKVPSA